MISSREGTKRLDPVSVALYLSGKKEIKDESASGEKMQSLWGAIFVNQNAAMDVHRTMTLPAAQANPRMIRFHAIESPVI
jgi:hypothetical protein